MSETKSNLKLVESAAPDHPSEGPGSPVTEEERARMISDAAYFLALRRGLMDGDPMLDWLEAEEEIDRRIGRHPPWADQNASARLAFQQKLEEQLEHWDARFEALKASARHASEDMREDVRLQIELLVGSRAEAQAKIHELRHRTEEAWEDVKAGAEKTWQDLHDALDKFIGRTK